MAKQKASGKIAAYVAKYSNASSGAGYRSAIEAFLRSVYGLERKDSEGRKITHDYEGYLDQYLSDKNRKHSEDVKTFSEYLVRESKSKQSARQVLTYGCKFLRAQGIQIDAEFVQDIKRETKGGSQTVAESLTNEMICHALRGASVRDRAIILTLASAGLRIGECLSLSVDDIKLDETPVRIVIRAAKAKNKHARFTYCSQEAKEAIAAWLKVRDSFLLESAKHNQNLIKAGKYEASQVDNKLLFPVSDSQINSSWEVCLKKAGLYKVDAETKRNIYRLHSLRKFFYSRLSNSIMPEKLVAYFVGHLTDLGNKYYIPTEEFAGAEYLKVEDLLTCCIPEKAKAAIKTLEIKAASLEKQDAIQYESIEYLREVNKKNEARLDSMQETVDALIAHIKGTKEYKSDTIVRGLESSVGVL